MMDRKYTLVLMPWLRLPQPCVIRGVHFVPYKKDQIPEMFQSYSLDINRILSSYRDIKGDAITECALIYLDGSGPCKDLTDNEVVRIDEAAQLLTCCALSKNEFYCQLGCYANSTAFQIFYQRFIPGSEWISITTRRRDGKTTCGGYEHGEVKFSIPVQCADLKIRCIDIPLLKALDKLFESPDPLAGRILQSVSLYNQANTDAETMLPQLEIWFLASAFEQLFANGYGADDLACKVSTLLDNYGSIRVSESTRIEDIQFSKKGGKDQEKKEKQWFLHRKWAQEFYQLRNSFVHGNDIKKRSWGWSLQEHLVMASFFFPLVVKILLSQESIYSLTDNDVVNLEVIDLLLNEKEWAEIVGTDSEASRWRETIRKRASDRAFEKAEEKAWKMIEDQKTNMEAENY